MALQDYTTPDGRKISLPPELASRFSQSLAPVQSAQPVGTVPPASTQPSIAPADTVTPPPGATSPPMLQPPLPVDTSPMPEPPSPPPVEQQRPSPTQFSQPQPAAPAPRPETSASLRAEGTAGAYNEQRGALEKARQAGTAQAQADIERSNAQADAYAQHMERQDALDKANAAQAQARLQQIAQRSADLDARIDKWSTTKLDTSVRHPILAGIAVALGAIGSALAGKGGENPALDMLLRQIDSNVNRQLAEREAGGKALSMQRQQIEGLRQQYNDQGALHAALTAAETARFKDQLGQLASRVTNKEQQAKLMQIDAGLDARIAEAKGAAIDKEQAAYERQQARALQVQQHRESLGVQYAQMAQADRHFAANLAFQREKEASDLKQAALKAAGSGNDARAKALQGAAKDNEERGIRDPATGELMLNDQGRKMTAQATAAEAEATKLRAQAKETMSAAMRAQFEARAQAAEDRASDLRAEALSSGVVRGRTAEKADGLQQKIADTQTALSLIDEIKRDAKAAGTKVLNANEIQTRLGAKLEILGLQLKEAWKLGALDEGTVDYMNKLTGGDPAKLTASGVLGALGIGSSSGEQASTRLDAVASSLESAAYNGLRGAGGTGFRFKRDQDVAASPENKAAEGILGVKTPLEQAAGEERGLLGKVAIDTIASAPSNAARSAWSAITGDKYESPEERRKRAAEESGSIQYPGFPKEQEPLVSTLIAGARAGNQRARDLLVQMATATDRPTISNATLSTLKGELPDLYRSAVDRLPQEQRDLRAAGAAAGAARDANLSDLAAAAKNGDKAAIGELIRRMQAGDRDAFTALQQTGSP